MRQSPAKHTSATVKAILAELDASMQAARVISDWMATHSLESVRIAAGQAEILRAKKAIKNFGRYLHDAVEEARQNRGDFGVAEGIVEKPAASKRSKKKAHS